VLAAALLALGLGFGLMLSPSVASASPTGVDFTWSPSGPAVGQAVTFTATAVCDIPPCRYQWRWYRPGSGGRPSTDRLGTTMGEGSSLTVRFDTAGTKNVLLKVSNSSGTNGFGQLNKYVIVT
jgi:hypothetical protein